MKRYPLFLFLLILLLGSCNTPPAAPQIVEVTRLVPEEVTRVVVERITVVPDPLAIVEETAITRRTPAGSLTVALPGIPQTLFPPSASDRASTYVTQQLFESLVRVDNSGQVVPALAEKWQLAADGVTYTFNLRPEVVFHDGTPFTAADVVASWEVGRQESQPRANFYQAASQVTAVDELTIEIKTSKPNVQFLYILSRWGILSAAQLSSATPADLKNQANGTGPFRLKSFAPEEVVLEANSTYWNYEQPALRQVLFRPYSAAQERASALASGAIDLADGLAYSHIRPFIGQGGVRLLSYPADRAFFITIYQPTLPADSPLQNPLVRQAMNYAVNRPVIQQLLPNDQTALLNGLLIPTHLGYDATLPPYPYDPAQARLLLETAGVTPEQLTVAMVCPSGGGVPFDKICQAVESDLEAVGFTIELSSLTSEELAGLQNEQALPPLVGDSWPSNGLEGLDRLNQLLGKGSKYLTWSDPEIERLLAELNRTFDLEERIKLYEELQAYLWENPPFLYLHVPYEFAVVQAPVFGYAPRPDGVLWLGEASVVEP